MPIDIGRFSECSLTHPISISPLSSILPYALT